MFNKKVKLRLIPIFIFVAFLTVEFMNSQSVPYEENIQENLTKVNDIEYVVTKEIAIDKKYIVIRRGKKQYYLVKYA